MRIYQAKNYYEMSCKAATMIASQIILKPDSTLGLATGSTPLGTYERLINKYLEGELDFSHINTINLDEYVGLDKNNNQSYYYYMYHELFSKINIPDSQYHLLNGMAKDSEEECCRYEKLIKDLGGIDLQLLGVGLNGHIGFNEPCDYFSKGTHLAKLTENTIKANSRFFENIEDVPCYAYTMGIKNIMEAKKIILIANGKVKAEIMKKIIEGPITPQVPASVLQLHNEVTVILDQEASSLLN